MNRIAPASGARAIRWGRIAGALAFLAPLVTYLATLAPTVTFEDSGEFIAAAYHLGVPHPSGYPLWCLLAHGFTLLPVGSVAERVHASSAFFGAAAVWLTYELARRLVGAVVPALLAALAFAGTEVLWSQSVVAEVYSLNACFSLGLLLLALRWRESRHVGWLLGLAFAFGLGLGNHPMLLLVGAPLGVWLLVLDGRALLRPALVVLGAVLFVAGLSVYLYLPLRAAADPPVNVGNPDTFARTVAHVGRDAYKAQGEQRRYAGTASDVVLHTGTAWRAAATTFGWPLALVALIGMATWAVERRDWLVLTLAVALGNTAALNALLLARHNAWWVFVHRVYYIPTHAMVALWVAAGLAWLLRAAASRGRLPAAAVVACAAVAVLLTARESYPAAQRRGDQRARNYALDVLDSAPPKSGFLPFHDELIYPLAYMRWVENVRPDVQVLAEAFGWRREAPRAVLIASPLVENMRQDFPELRDYASIPRGIVHQVLPAAAAQERSGWADFVPLPHPPRDLQTDWPVSDPFSETVQSRYAAYHAHRGARLLALDRPDEGHAALARAEALDPADAGVEVLLFDIYRDFGLYRERWRGLLEGALENYDAKVDPAIDRNYPVTRGEIERRLEALEPR